MTFNVGAHFHFIPFHILQFKYPVYMSDIILIANKFFINTPICTRFASPCSHRQPLRMNRTIDYKFGIYASKALYNWTFWKSLVKYQWL